MRKLAYLFLWLFASASLYAASDSMHWHPLPEGDRTQSADMMALTANDFKLVVGAVNGQRDVILNVTSSSGKEGPMVYRYTPGGALDPGSFSLSASGDNLFNTSPSGRPSHHPLRPGRSAGDQYGDWLQSYRCHDLPAGGDT